MYTELKNLFAKFFFAEFGMEKTVLWREMCERGGVFFLGGGGKSVPDSFDNISSETYQPGIDHC